LNEITDKGNEMPKRKRRIIKAPKVVKEKKLSQYARIDSEHEPRNKFEALRRSLGLTQEAFGEKLGLSKAMVFYYETDYVAPSVTTWVKVKANAKANGIELGDDILNEFLEKKVMKKKERLTNKIERMEKEFQEKMNQLNNQIKQYQEIEHGTDGCAAREFTSMGVECDVSCRDQDHS
jgi:DNA-binding XRE family transcriptional regulator